MSKETQYLKDLAKVLVDQSDLIGKIEAILERMASRNIDLVTADLAKDALLDIKRFKKKAINQGEPPLGSGGV
jgi:2-phospho-L-lactate guanylyltransferase (CobY/MobA/RfbA family)